MIWKIAWKNIVFKPLNSIVCLILLLFGVSIISLLLTIQHQIEQKFEQNLNGVDIVIGAKGSPLQLVLSAVYHLDSPTGNIKLSEVEKIMDNPMIEEAIPLSYGDSYRGYRILGTSTAYLSRYNAKIEEGRIYEHSMETTLGAHIAEKLGLQIGDSFLGTHGEAKEGHVHEDEIYTVVGILSQSNTVLDNLILTGIESVWQVHDSQHGHHNETDTSMIHEHTHNKEITALLLKCKTKLAILNTPRKVNQQTNMQAALPGLEINRLFYMLGIGATTLKFIAGSIIVMAGLNLFFTLYTRLKERKYELALMRSVGYKPLSLFKLLLLEGLLLVVIGHLPGVLLSRLGLYFINFQVEDEFNTQFGYGLVKEEFWLLLIIILVGFLAALLPAWKATKVEVSATLSGR